VKERFEFSVAGVTMADRQKILRQMRNICLKTSSGLLGDKKIGDKSPRYLATIRRLKLRIRQDKKNPYDTNAIRVEVFSKLQKVWHCLGFVPKKYLLKLKGKEVPLNRVISLLIKSGRIKRSYLSDLSYFHNEQDELVYYCKVTLEIKPEE
jgi:hypothetical protein